MSLPRASYDPRRVFLISCPSIPFYRHRRTIGVYLSGALFAIANWVFLDAAIYSAHAQPPPDAPYDTVPVHVTFLDWLPGIISMIGLLVVNLIDKDRLTGEGAFGGSGDSRAVWRARVILFLGFAMMAGGLAGSVCVLVLKYIIQEYPEQYNFYGIAAVVQNVSLMLSAVVLWLAQNASEDDEYNYQLTI
ncbi:UPF0220-domain-containing protein [Sistotremastrum niveocremeum HHB9708]|uniref:UPF0220-domain-containing protein n=1 Tax=Sistotremastrum niveocremeum HHB9708 TaxID=1314777 RepID=A0A164XZF4_9AGAM|nr:UPF0220-domain-containing protein [Sistotremastrum niveocremeum HHB9708]